MTLPFPNLTPEEAAAMIEDHQTVGFSGFTAAGTTKAIPVAIAAKAEREHGTRRPFKIGVISGASTGRTLDGALARANAVLFRTPYQANPDLRRMINAGETRFFDMHLSALPGAVRMGSLGPLHWAVIEASDITADGQLTLTTSVGASPTFCSKADRILVELNRAHPPELRGLHDIYEPASPPRRREIPIYSSLDRAGSPCVQIDPAKIAGIVETDSPDEPTILDPRSEITDRIGGHVAEFLASEIRAGRISDAPLAIEVGGGNIANAMLAVMGRHPGIPQFEIYAEVIQDSAVRLLQEGRCRALSAVSLSVGSETLQSIYANLAELKKSMVLRPQEISNCPEIIQRLGLVAINTAVEVDIHGNANSSHVMGQSVLNGIGGSGDFTRNAAISVFICPSTASDGAISSIVPMVSHTDHNEHSVQVVVTEQGIADLRGKDPRERAQVIIGNCAHPNFRDDLWRYCALSPRGHMPQSLRSAFKMHQQFMETGSMRGVDWSR
jgi:succinate CoA transferase